MALVLAGQQPAARVDLVREPLLVGADQRDDRMQGLAGGRADDDADFVAIGAHDRSEREEADGVDERLDQRRVELRAGESRQHQARLLGHRGFLVRPRAGHRLVDVGHRDDLTEEVRHGGLEIGIAGAVDAAMVLERHGRRERPQAVDFDEDLRAVGRVRLHHPPLALVERARLLQNLERNPRLADVVQQRRLGERRGRRLIESDLLADEQAERRHVDRMAVGEVLVELDRQNLAERGVARGDLLNQQVHDVADRRQVDPLARHHVVERPLGERQRQLVRRIQRAARRVGPLHGLPARVERHEPAEADVLNVRAPRAGRRAARRSAPP